MVYGHLLTLAFDVIQKCRHVDALEREIEANRAAARRLLALFTKMRCAHCLQSPFFPDLLEKDVIPDA